MTQKNEMSVNATVLSMSELENVNGGDLITRLPRDRRSYENTDCFFVYLSDLDD